MRIPKRFLQFSLRTLLLVMLATCLVAYFDPLGWRPPLPVPIKTVEVGQTAEVDLIELNHFYDANGRLVFSQLLFWSIHADGKLHVREWCLLKTPSMKPQRGYKKWVCTWTVHGIHRRVEAPRFRETRSMADQELTDRLLLRKEQRIQLWAPKNAESSRVAAATGAANGP